MWVLNSVCIAPFMKQIIILISIRFIWILFFFCTILFNLIFIFITFFTYLNYWSFLILVAHLHASKRSIRLLFLQSAMCLNGSQYFSISDLDWDLSFFFLNHILLSNHYFCLSFNHFRDFGFLRDFIETKTSIFFENAHYHFTQIKLLEKFQTDILPLLQHLLDHFHFWLLMLRHHSSKSFISVSKKMEQADS